MDYGSLLHGLLALIAAVLIASLIALISGKVPEIEDTEAEDTPDSK